MKLRLVIACACVVAPPAVAENRALIMGTQTYGEDVELTAEGDVSAAIEALGAAGFDVISGVDLEIDALRENMGSLLTDEAPERSVILLSGRFAHSGHESWYLPGAADAPSLATVDGAALSLSTVMEIAGRSQGGAVVLLGSPMAELEDLNAEAGVVSEASAEDAPDDLPFALGFGLMPGLGTITPPQGVTVIAGDIPDILSFVEDALVMPGLSLPEMLADKEELQAYGFLSPLLSFLPADDATSEAEPVEEQNTESEAEAEGAVWQAAQDTDTIVAYEAYLAQYPEGAFAADARAAIDALAADPERIEAALELGASTRQHIQRQLNVLGYDTRGVDGIFGPGTRNAISNWQQDSGLDATSFLTAEQIDVLNDMATTREAELEEEAREQELERERADRAYWEDTGRGQDEAGLRAYLERFPDGLFSDVAGARLAEIETARDREAWETALAEDTEAAYRRYLDAHEDGAFADSARARLAEMGEEDALAADEAAWSAAQQIDTADAYARYLEDFPEGAFSEPATQRLDELTEDAPEQDEITQEQAREAEAALGLNTITRGLVEVLLTAQGFNPGRTDGQFDSDTRAALRAYQEARGLPVSGYVDSETQSQMISDGLPLSR